MLLYMFSSAISLYVCMGLSESGLLHRRLTKIPDFFVVYDGNTNFHLCMSVQEAVNDAVTFNKFVNEGQQGGSAGEGTCY